MTRVTVIHLKIVCFIFIFLPVVDFSASRTNSLSSLPLIPQPTATENGFKNSEVRAKYSLEYPT
jgi:hypothetical protein